LSLLHHCFKNIP